MALICLENYPAALEDSLQAIRLDEKFVKVSFSNNSHACVCYLCIIEVNSLYRDISELVVATWHWAIPNRP